MNFGSNSCAYIYADGILDPVCSLVDGQGGAAFSINNFQQLAGTSDGHGFIYSNGTVAEVGLLPQGTFSGLLSLNDYGQATGQADTDPNPYQGNAGRSHAILYSFSTRTLTDLGTLPTGDQSYGLGINNVGEVTGWGYAGATYHAFLDSAGKMMVIGAQPGWVASQGLAVNSLGQVLGFFYDADFVPHAFLYQIGSAQDLGPGMLPYALNDFAEIVGLGNLTSQLASGTPALYSDGVVHDLNTLIPAGTELTLVDPVAINNSGQIISNGFMPNSTLQEYVLSPICDRRQYPISESNLKKNEHWCLAAKGIPIVPFSAAFGDVAVGTTSSSITVTETNTSRSPIVFLGAERLRHFDFEPGTCSLKDGRRGLEPGAACTFSVSFSPTRAGADQGRILLGTSAGLVVFHLAGTGTN